MRIFSLLLVATAFTLLFPSALLFIMPGEVGVNLVLLGISSPLIWTSAMLYSYWDHKPWRPPAIMGSVIAVSCVIVVFSELS